MALGSTGKISSGTTMLRLKSSTMEREVTVGIALFHTSQIIFRLSLSYECSLSFCPLFLSFSLSLSGPCHKSCGDYCWGPNEDQCQICECPIVLFPFYHFLSVFLSLLLLLLSLALSLLNVFLHRQKYTETEGDAHT